MGEALAPSLLSNYGLPRDNTRRIQIRNGERAVADPADQSLAGPRSLERAPMQTREKTHADVTIDSGVTDYHNIMVLAFFFWRNVLLVSVHCNIKLKII